MISRLARPARPVLMLLFSLALAAHAREALAGGDGPCAGLSQMTLDQLLGPTDEFMARHNSEYTHTVPMTDIENQMEFGSCWIHGTCGNISSYILARTGKVVNIDENYTIIGSLIVQAGNALRVPGALVMEGGTPELAALMIDRLGIIPEGVWKPKFPFMTNPLKDRLMEHLNNRIMQFHEDVLSAANATTGATSIERHSVLLQQAQRDIVDLLETYAVGKGFPEPSTFKFMYEGKEYTPLTFKKAFLPHWGPVRKLRFQNAAAPAFLKPFQGPLDQFRRETILDAMNGIASEEMKVDDLEQELIKHFARVKEPGYDPKVNPVPSVLMSIEINDSFMSNLQGIMATDLFHAPAGFRVPSREIRDAYSAQKGMHLIEVTGIDVSHDGHIIKFQVKNTWGKMVGNAGVYDMYRNYWQAFGRDVWLRDRLPEPMKLLPRPKPAKKLLPRLKPAPGLLPRNS